MTLFFNEENLDKEAGNDSAKYVALLNYHYSGALPKNSRVKYKPSKLRMAGLSFMLNPAPIFLLRNVDINYIVQYIKLCALRDYSLFKFNTVASLDLSFFPDIYLDAIRHNPLISIDNKRIFFKYEEDYIKHRKI